MSNVLVVAEIQSGALKKATTTAVTFARDAAARTGGQVHGLAIGHGEAASGAEVVLHVDDEQGVGVSVHGQHALSFTRLG